MQESCDFFVFHGGRVEERFPTYPAIMEAFRSEPAMSSCQNTAASEVSSASMLCAVTWNVGSESDLIGVGMGGLKGPELKLHLRNLLQQQCQGAAVVVVALQEGADREISTYLQSIAADMSSPSAPLHLWANTFAGVKPSADSESIAGLSGVVEHTAFALKTGILIKEGQWLKGDHKRKVVLTTRALSTYKISTDIREEGTPVGSPTNSLDLRLGFTLTKKDATCFFVQGFEKDSGDKVTEVGFKLCAETTEERDAWISAMERELTKMLTYGAGRDFSTSEHGVLEVPFANGVSMAFMSIAKPTQVQLFAVDFKCATRDGSCGGGGFGSWLKQQARGLTFTTADKGGAILRVELGGQKFCFASCHLEAKDKEKRWRQSQLMADALQGLSCDAEIWMGDFNTRPSNDDGEGTCCPWAETELAVLHGFPEALREHIKDDLKFMLPAEDSNVQNGGVASRYKEMPINFPPTFHKRFKRKSTNQCSALDAEPRQEQLAEIRNKTAVMDMLNLAAVPMGPSLSDLRQLNKGEFKRGRCEARSSSLCWGGVNAQANCETGGCFNTHDKEHCPGYTDRILYRSGSGVILEPCNYVAANSFSAADHAPVVGTFRFVG